MYEYIKGLLVEATPAYAVIECGGGGDYINISVNTYSQIVALQQVSLYIHQIVREDALLLYGFFNKEERTVFRQLISVSGIGANTASVMLSSMTVKPCLHLLYAGGCPGADGMRTWQGGAAVCGAGQCEGNRAEDGPAGDYRIER